VKMVVIAFLTHGSVGLPPSRLDRLLGRLEPESALEAADQFASSRFDQGLAHLKVVRGLEELHQSPLHFPVAHVLRNPHRFLGERINARLIHSRGDVERYGTLHEVSRAQRDVCVSASLAAKAACVG
jgi:hypothetical protein